MKHSQYKKIVDKFTADLMNLTITGAPFSEWSNVKDRFDRDYGAQLSNRRRADLFSMFNGLFVANMNQNTTMCYDIKNSESLPMDGLYATNSDECCDTKLTLMNGEVVQTTEILHMLSEAGVDIDWNRYEKIMISKIHGKRVD